MGEQKRRYPVPPDPSLMENIGATSFTVAEAIVELVANSIDARPEDDRPLEIHVDISPDEIRIVDSASGMDGPTLAEAVRLGVKMDQLTGRKRLRKGMFGLGMKTAAASLGRYWAVVTRPIGGTSEFSVEFDLEAYRRRRGETNFDWAVEIVEREPDLDGLLEIRENGTAIVVRQLREHNPMAGPVLELLGNAYKPHIEQGDHIFVNGDEARPREYEFLDGSKHEIDLRVGQNGEYHIVGWVALDRQTHNAGDYGFNLYRKNQLIEAWSKEWFQPHLMTSRIIGEADLDFVEVNFNKKGFQTQTPEWKLASQEMREFLRPVVRASREVSRGRADTGKYTRAVEGLNRAMGRATVVGVLEAEGAERDVATGDGQSPLTASPIEVQPNTLMLADGEVRLSYVVEEFDSEQTPWDYIYEDHARELQAVLNANSRLYSQVKDEKFLGMLAIADCVTRFLMDKRGFSASYAREIRDLWLYVSLDEG